MPQNILSDLNNHLFTALERLNEEGLTPEQIEAECKRAESVSAVANQIISNAKITIDAMRLVTTGKFEVSDLPENFGIKKIGN